LHASTTVVLTDRKGLLLNLVQFKTIRFGQLLRYALTIHSQAQSRGERYKVISAVVSRIHPNLIGRRHFGADEIRCTSAEMQQLRLPRLESRISEVRSVEEETQPAVRRKRRALPSWQLRKVELHEKHVFAPALSGPIHTMRKVRGPTGVMRAQRKSLSQP